MKDAASEARKAIACATSSGLPGLPKACVSLLRSRNYNNNINKEGNVLFNALNTFFYNGYMASDIWLWTILIARKETRRCHIGYSFRLTARVILYAPPHRQDSTYHSLCYTSRGVLAGTRNSSMDPTTHRTMSECSYHGATSCS